MPPLKGYLAECLAQGSCIFLSTYNISALLSLATAIRWDQKGDDCPALVDKSVAGCLFGFEKILKICTCSVVH